MKSRLPWTVSVKSLRNLAPELRANAKIGSGSSTAKFVDFPPVSPGMPIMIMDGPKPGSA